jgi:hypothetical protein
MVWDFIGPVSVAYLKSSRRGFGESDFVSGLGPDDAFAAFLPAIDEVLDWAISLFA